MSKETLRYPGLNLGSARPHTNDAAETVMFGFWVFLMSDAILFGLAFSIYLVSLDAAAGGPTPVEIYKMKPVFIETMLLLASSFTYGMASLVMKHKESVPQLVGWLLVTLGLGVAFLWFEVDDFLKMISEDAVPMRSGLWSAFWGLVPLHGLHVTSGCIWMLCLFGQLARYGLDDQTQLGIMRLALFWHFLDIIWIGIFSVVYLAGLA